MIFMHKDLKEKGFSSYQIKKLVNDGKLYMVKDIYSTTKEINYLDSLDSRRIIREIFLNHHNTSDLEKLMNYNRSNIYKLRKDAYSQFANLIQKWTTLDSIG